MIFSNFEDISSAFREYLIEVNEGKEHTIGMYYPKIAHTFIPYLSEKYFKEKEEENSKQDIDSFLKRGISDIDISKSVIEDVKRVLVNRGVVSERAVKNYLIAIRQFFYFLESKGIGNANIKNIFSNNHPLRNIESDKLMEQILENLKKEKITLKPSANYPPLRDVNDNINEAEYLQGQLRKENFSKVNIATAHNYKKINVVTMLQLFLLLGLSPQKLHELQIRDYSITYNQIKITSSSNNFPAYTITLPHNISDNLKILVTHKKTNLNSVNEDRLFLKNNGNIMDEGYLHNYLKKYKQAFIEKQRKAYKPEELQAYIEQENTFTPMGISKYAVIQMLRSGATPTIVSDFTGHGNTIIDDCQEIALSQMYNQSRYLDSLIRGLNHYDEF